MKKLLVLLALCMVISVVLVACTKEPQGGDDTTPDEVTTDPTTDPGSDSESEDPTTEEPTTEDPTTEDPTTEEPTTEEPTEPPVVIDPVIVHLSFDQLYKGNGSPDSGENFFAPGQSNSWDGNAAIDHTVTYITFWGWVGFYAETIGEFGYQIGDADPVFSADFAWETGDDVVNAAAGAGAKSASRMKMAIPVLQLGAGETTVKALVKDAVGTIEVMKEFKVVKTVPYLEKTDSASGFIGWSFDGFYVNDALYFAEDGNAASKLEAQNKIVPVIPSEKYQTIGFRGWTSFNQETAAFGYFIAGVDTDIVFGEFLQERPDLAGAGIQNGCGFRIDVPTADLGVGSYNVSIYAKLADETVVKLYDITLDILGPAKDTTNTFVSDVNGNEAGAKFDAADIGNIMVLRQGTAGWAIVEEGGVKSYFMNGIDAVTADMNGAYYFKANIIQAANNAGVGMVVRGYNSTVSSDENVAYKVTNFYETDGADFCGGSGIYAYVNNGTLNIVVKYYNPDNGTRVGNKIYRLPAEGTELVIADNGYTVSVILNDVTYAVIDLSGSTVYEDITTTPEGAFATKAVVSLKDGTVETIENTLVAATVDSQVGLTCRASQFKFTSVEVGGFSAITVPALEIVLPEPVDPLAPVAVGNANYLAQVAGSGNQIASAVLSDDGTYVTITSGAGGDPNFFVLPGGSRIEGVKYVSLVYRTTIAAGGEFFIGSASITGGADELKFDYVADGEWHVLLLDLSTHSTVVDGLVNYLRYDFYMGGENQSIDVKEIVLFNSIESYNKYYGIEDTTPEVENYNVPMDQWAVTGHKAGITPANDPSHGPMVAAGGIDNGALLHQGYVGVGEVDLSKYSKVVISYGIDNSQVTIDHYNANPANRIALCKADAAMTNSPTDDNVIASTTYTLQGWKLVTIEIDLTGVDYNGPVFVTYDTLPGTFMLIGAIEFVA